MNGTDPKNKEIFLDDWMKGFIAGIIVTSIIILSLMVVLN